MAGSVVNEVLGGLTGVNHETVLRSSVSVDFLNAACLNLSTYSELHGLGTGSTELAGNDNLATLGTRLHDETENTIARTTDGETVEELVAEGLALGNSTETTVLDLGGIKGDGVLGELEALLDEGGQLADAATLLTENLLGVGGTDN